ncbi:hypothetical protein ACLOJK_038999, partial [Asimina triloba]
HRHWKWMVEMGLEAAAFARTLSDLACRRHARYCRCCCASSSLAMGDEDGLWPEKTLSGSGSTAAVRHGRYRPPWDPSATAVHPCSRCRRWGLRLLSVGGEIDPAAAASSRRCRGRGRWVRTLCSPSPLLRWTAAMVAVPNKGDGAPK